MVPTSSRSLLVTFPEGFYSDTICAWILGSNGCLQIQVAWSQQSTDVQIAKDSGFPGGNHIPLMPGLAVSAAI